MNALYMANISSLGNFSEHALGESNVVLYRIQESTVASVTAPITSRKSKMFM